jgi:hypothetical protein
MFPGPRIPLDGRRLYVFGWLAMKFDGRPGRDVPSYFRENFGVEVSEDTVERAIEGLRGRNGKKKARGNAKQGDLPAPDEQSTDVAIWTDWLRVDESQLGVRKVLVRIPNDGFPLPELTLALERMPGIRQVIETKELREILAIGLVRTEEEEEDLRSRIQEHAPGRSVSVIAIRQESHAPTALTWHRIAMDEARAGTSQREES